MGVLDNCLLLKSENLSNVRYISTPLSQRCHKEDGENSGEKQQKISKFIVKASEMSAFFELIENPVIVKFLKTDSCMLIADKYLLSMVFAYFKRASFSIRDYNRLNFFVALYLANDVEEDEEEIKYEIFPWALGQNWDRRVKDFLRLRDLLFRRMDYKAIISRRCCDEIMAIEPEHPLWQRCRPTHHGGAVRSHTRDASFGTIYGPYKSPNVCLQCDVEQGDGDQSDSTMASISPITMVTSPDISSTGSETVDDSDSDKENMEVNNAQHDINQDRIWCTLEE